MTTRGIRSPVSRNAVIPSSSPSSLTADPATAYDRALDVANSMDWEIVASDRALGRIEATDTSTWYGFKDDIVVRVISEDAGTGSRIDVRSLSRVGRSDVGVNAARIKAFLAALDVAL